MASNSELPNLPFPIGSLEQLSNREIKMRTKAALGGWSNALIDAFEHFCDDVFALSPLDALQQFRN